MKKKLFLFFVAGIAVGFAGFVQDVYFDPGSLSQYQHVHWTFLPIVSSNYYRQRLHYFVRRKRCFLNLAPKLETSGTRIVRELEDFKETLDKSTTCRQIKVLALDLWGQWIATGRRDKASRLTVWFQIPENVRRIEQAVDWEQAKQSFPSIEDPFFFDRDFDETLESDIVSKPISDETLVSKPSSTATRPARVRYAWDHYPDCDLVSADGLPVGPFELPVGPAR